ncbi:MAG: hypothetical protein C4520_17685 [Candidatus Abyssobacteria bacterium SURF_5]|uniref:MoaD/ThiS family protein n=1 Tax=Abyssobacteria bacterium (strain SURF_5) TaxID=2093360 RepID=A0A3A4NIR1_ABYX5|nr:MAG: hypothetical protein C4520_17685 [Candidatus Abyssubacteria bacterium SURF_5]
MKVKVRYLGAFADAVKYGEVLYDCSAITLDSLVEELAQRNGEKFRKLLVDPATGDIRGGAILLLNGHRIALDHPLCEHDELVFLTPVAGGKR